MIHDQFAVDGRSPRVQRCVVLIGGDPRRAVGPVPRSRPSGSTTRASTPGRACPMRVATVSGLSPDRLALAISAPLLASVRP